MAIDVPRDREGSLKPQIVKKRQRRLTGVDEMVLSLSARGLTHGEISAHLRAGLRRRGSKTTVSTITDKVIDGMPEWQNRPLDSVYPILSIDCVHVKLRDGKVANPPIYVAVTVEGAREILGLWAVCDGLKGLPDAIEAVWPQAITQTCVVHLIRASFRYAARQNWDKVAKMLKPVYTAPTEEAATERFLEFLEVWGTKYPAS